MRLLFNIGTESYDNGLKVVIRPSARSIIIRQGRIAMVHSLKYDYYKFPGGGIESGESRIDALIRETAEEAGLTVIPDSIREYGCVHRVQERERDVLIQDNFYYVCSAEDGKIAQALDDYEADERFTPVWTDPHTAIRANRLPGHGPKSPTMLEREAKVLETLINEGYFD